jgi:very-short-patch-repair endonuclease
MKVPRYARVPALAARQHGVVAHRQLLAIGLGRLAIKYQVECGRLHPIYVGVYAVGHPVLSLRGRWMAAVLACGDDAVLSHRDAGALWQLRPTAGARVHVTAVGRTRHPRRGIVVHRVRALDPRDVTCRDGIPVTTVARTLLDLAEILLPRQLERVFEEAERRRVLDLRAVEEVCRRSNGRRGLRPLRALLAAAREPATTRSELEAMFRDFCRDLDLPVPVFNALVAGYEVDASWPGSRLIVELDGYAFHRTRGAFERDRMKSVALKTSEYEVLRVTERMLRTEPSVVADAIRKGLVGPATRTR